MLPSSPSQRIQQAKFTCSPLGKALEKQTKTIKDQGDKQIKAVKNQEEKQLTVLNDAHLYAS